MVKQTQTPSSLNYVDELDCGSFFDQIDDLIDFPSDDEEPIAAEKYEDGSSFTPSSIWAGQPGSDSVFSTHCGSDLSAELSVPYEDILQLEWLSTFVEDSFSGGGGEGEGFLTMSSNNNNNEIECSILDKDLSPSTMLSNQQFRTSSPISVLESTSFCSRDQKPLSTKKANVGTKKHGRPRSKRTCPSTYASWPQMQHKSEQKVKNKRIKVTPAPHSHAGGMDEQNNQDSAEQKHQGVRKCTHCQVTKTPQWRAGPTGAKTLCNACGMRYKSGRLLPEYRPAASPTYVPSLHSNSHRKVLEMRIKTTSTTSGDHDETLRITDGSTASMIAHSPELLIPNHNSSLYI